MTAETSDTTTTNSTPVTLLHQPKPFDVDNIKTAQEFSLWKKQAELCVKVNKLDKLPKDVLCAHILLLCGSSVIKHESQFVYDATEDKEDPATLWRRIESLCIPDKSEVMERFRFKEMQYEEADGILFDLKIENLKLFENLKIFKNLKIFENLKIFGNFWKFDFFFENLKKIENCT